MKLRLGFIVTAKATLIEKLKSDENELWEYFINPSILATEELDYEESFEGWKKTIRECAKETFIREYVLSLDYGESYLYAAFGEFNSNTNLFDRWWELREADCEIIPTTWLNT